MPPSMKMSNMRSNMVFICGDNDGALNTNDDSSLKQSSHQSGMMVFEKSQKQSQKGITNRRPLHRKRREEVAHPRCQESSMHSGRDTHAVPWPRKFLETHLCTRSGSGKSGQHTQIEIPHLECARKDSKKGVTQKRQHTRSARGKV